MPDDFPPLDGNFDPARIVTRNPTDCPRCGTGDGAHLTWCPVLRDRPANANPSSVEGVWYCASCQARMARATIHGDTAPRYFCVNQHCPKGLRVSPVPTFPAPAESVSRETPPLSAFTDRAPIYKTMLPGTWEQALELEDIGHRLLAALGVDASDPSLRETPRRWAKWWQEFITYEDTNTETAFDAVSTDQMIVVRGVRVWSLCEHHLLPFSCDVTMGYIARGKILGLSKFARIAHLYAHRLQVQERLTTQIADHIARVTGSPDVAVIGDGEHLCMTMRGARSPHRMASSALRGAFLTDARAREEWLHLAQDRR